MAADGLDLDAFAALMEEEGEPDAGVGVVDDGEGEEGEREFEPVPLHDAPVAPEKKGVGRLYPVRKPGVATTAVKSTAATGVPHRTAGSGAGSLPSYMRGTATSDVRAARSRSPAAHDAGSHSTSTGVSTGRTGYGGSGSGASHTASSATATGGRRPSGASGKPAEPKIAGKPLFSGLPENAARAELIRNVEACITEAATLGPDGKPAGVTLDDVVGLEDAKRALEEAIVFPRVMMEMGTPGGFTKGVLLFGPPGTGKTQIARAQATCSGCCFIAVSPAVLISKWMGDSERMVKALFETAHYYAPAIVFIDEIDALCGERGSGGENESTVRVKNELLGQMDGVTSSSTADKLVLVLAATNRPWALDEAFRRRLEKRILIPLPDAGMRLALFAKALKKGNTRVSDDVKYEAIAQRTDGYSCADIVLIARDATVAPLRELAAQMKREGVPIAQMPAYVAERGPSALVPVNMSHIEDALRRIRSSVGGSETIKRMADWATEFGST